ncbi:MAG: aldehyde dehydrogenase [Deltaproteobacteria bacterium]|nr:aldehyde dehydrogenase [Deltaproteobacteria bacterium]
MTERLAILKTYKLYIGGKFPRTESNRYYQVTSAKGKLLANASRGSRKDIRDAVVAARKAFSDWSGRSAFNRGQILYRAAEMLESHAQTFIDEIMAITGKTKKQAGDEVTASIDRLVWYAGWADKYMQLFSTVNPVATKYWNFTYPEPTGVVGIICPDEMPLLGMVSKVAPAVVSGNTCVVIASETNPLTPITFSEVIATSDFPGGVINIITGFKSELCGPLATHMDVNAIDYSGQDEKTISSLQEAAATNVKRVVIRRTPHGNDWLGDTSQSPYWIEPLVEMKTAWHPVGS